MSMLAEPRRKQRIGPNPRGKFFTEDEDNRGRNMLQKMGWNHGDGLGVERQGIREPIRPKIQTDSKGLGFDIKTDPWVAHNDDFNEVLRNLQAANGGVVEDADDGGQGESSSAGFGFGFKPEESQKKKMKHIDLESNSKSSRSRIHYHKFVKNKDLSKIKTEDWNCIFGKPVGDIGVKKADPVESKEAEEEKEDSYSSDLFINRGSLKDYFKCKKAQKSIQPEYHQDDSVDTDSFPHNSLKRKKASKTYVEGTLEYARRKAWEEWRAEELGISEPPPPKKQKEEETVAVAVDETSLAVDIDESEELTERQKRKKEKREKKRQKELDRAEKAVAEEQIIPTVESSPSEAPPQVEPALEEDSCEKPKTKRKRDRKVKDGESEITNKSEELIDSSEKSGAEEVEGTEKFVNRGSMEDYFKSKMEGRLPNKDSQVEDQEQCSEAVAVVEETSEETPRKKKKKDKKSKVESDISERLESNSSPVHDNDQEELTEKQKRKKKRKDRKVQNEEVTNDLPSEQGEEQEIEPAEKFVNCGSMEDYFKAKMASRLLNNATSASLTSVENDKELCLEDVVVPEEEAEEQQTKKKKKEKKVKSSSEEETQEGGVEPADTNIQEQDELMDSNPGEVTTESSIKPEGSAKGNFKKPILTAHDYHEAAKEFSGSNLLKIPGYRNQSNKFL